MMDELKPLIDANTSISPKAYCNIPGRIIALPINKDTSFLYTCHR